MTWAVLNPDIHTAIIEMTATRRDRVIAVVGGAIIEEALLRALDLRMRAPPTLNKPSFAMERLFEPSRPLGAFGAKIDLGFALQLYDKDVHSTLDGFRRIRNIFAHDLKLKSFGAADAKLQGAFGKLRLHNVYTHYPAPLWKGLLKDRVLKPKSKKSLFTTNMKLVLILLMRDLRLHLPYSNERTPLLNPPVNA